MDVVVIGGSAAGLKAACRIARLQPDANVKVLIKSDKFGYSSCGLPYLLSGDLASYDVLISTANGTIKDQKYFRNVKSIDVLPLHEAYEIDRNARLVRGKNLTTGEEFVFPYDRLVIATGSVPIVPTVPGTESSGGVMFFSRPDDAIRLRAELERGEIERASIIGAGFIGIELCEAFSALWGIQVDLIEMQSQVLAGLVDVEIARMIEEELKNQGISLLLGCGCREIVGKDSKVCIFDSHGEALETDRIIIATGVHPNSELAREAGLEIGVTGGIKVNDRLATSDPDIFAAGDCVELQSIVDGHVDIWSLGSLANRMGRVAGDNACNGDSRFGRVAGVTILKLFDITIGAVGLSTAACAERGYEVDFSCGTFHDRLFYYPEASPINCKLIYDRSTGKVMGFQAVSRGSIHSVLDKAAYAIKNGATVDDLKDIEHAYAPPFSQPFDPLHYLAFIVDNSHSAGVKLYSPAMFETFDESTVILDVRSPHEVKARPLSKIKPSILEIPVEELRERISEVPSRKEIVAICQTGGRAWDAALMLRRAGWREVGILAGGALFMPKAENSE